MTVTLTIPGKPFAKQRPRFSRAQGRAFTPKETVAFERVVQQIAARQFDEPLSGPVRLTILATFETPKSWSQKKTKDHIWRAHTQRPDLDNIVKSIKDALNRIAYADDGQVSEVVARKLWGTEGCTVVHVDQAT